MWDWGGRVKVGAFTAELGTWRNLPVAEEVRDDIRVHHLDNLDSVFAVMIYMLCKGRVVQIRNSVL